MLVGTEKCEKERRRSPLHTWMLLRDPTRLECHRCPAVVHANEVGFDELLRYAREVGGLRWLM